MEAVIIPGKTVVHINGIPVRLAVDTIVETTIENRPMLTGYAYAYLPELPGGAGAVAQSDSIPA